MLVIFVVLCTINDCVIPKCFSTKEHSLNKWITSEERFVSNFILDFGLVVKYMPRIDCIPLFSKKYSGEVQVRRDKISQFFLLQCKTIRAINL